MNELLVSTLWVLGLLASVSGLLYVLAAIDPQTNRTGSPSTAAVEVPVSP